MYSIILSGLPDNQPAKLQKVQHTAAQVITRTRKTEHMTPILSEIHWLPVKYCVDFKILVHTYKAQNSLAPDYIRDLLSVCSPTLTLRSHMQATSQSSQDSY